jgi:hypothetical protein
MLPMILSKKFNVSDLAAIGGWGLATGGAADVAAAIEGCGMVKSGAPDPESDDCGMVTSDVSDAGRDIA